MKVNKKGSGINTIMGFVIAIFIVLILIFAVTKYYSKFNNATSECRGTCKSAEKGCGSIFKTNAGTCVVNGVAYKDQVCCMSASDWLKSSEPDDDKDTPKDTPSGKNVIEVRIGDSDAKVMKSTGLTLFYNDEIELHIWGEGKDAYSCSALFLRNNKKTIDAGLDKKIDKQPCVGEKNKKSITLKPSVDAKYTLQVQLFDKNKKQIASELIPVTIGCPYSSCYDVPPGLCLNDVPACPDLDCVYNYNEADGSGECVYYSDLT